MHAIATTEITTETNAATPMWRLLPYAERMEYIKLFTYYWYELGTDWSVV